MRLTRFRIRRNVPFMSKLRTWRKARRMTQGKFAEKFAALGLDTHMATISRIELGELWPSPKIVAAIEKITRGAVTAADIFADYQAANKGRINAAE